MTMGAGPEDTVSYPAEVVKHDPNGYLVVRCTSLSNRPLAAGPFNRITCNQRWRESGESQGSIRYVRDSRGGHWYFEISNGAEK